MLWQGRETRCCMIHEKHYEACAKILFLKFRIVNLLFPLFDRNTYWNCEYIDSSATFVHVLWQNHETRESKNLLCVYKYIAPELYSLLMTSLFTFYHCLLSPIIFYRFHVIGVGPYPTFTLPYLIFSYLSLSYILPYLTSYLTFRYLTLHFALPYLTLCFAFRYLTLCLTLPYLLTLHLNLPYLLPYILPYLTFYL